MIEKYVEISGPDQGRLKDIDLAMDLAYTEDAWRQENEGLPMLSPPERLGKPEVHFRDILNTELKRLIIIAAKKEIDSEFDSLYEKSDAKKADPETSDESWVHYRAASAELANSTVYQ